MRVCKWCIRSSVSVVAIVLLCGMTQSGWSDAAREKQLEQTVEMLLKRLEVLEEKVDVLSKTPAPTAEIEERLAKVESAAVSPNSINTYWKSGLNFETQDKSIKLKIGGRIHNDWFTGDIDDGDFPDGTRFRRARLAVSGVLYDDVKFKTQYDFAGDGTANWKDVYAEYTGLDFAKIRIGQFHEPFSQEPASSSNYLPFIERSPISGAGIAPDRQSGVMLYDEILDKRMTWAIGAFLPSNDFGDAEEDDGEPGDWDIAARLTGLPWYEDGGEKLLHLGASVAHREWDGDMLRYRARGSFSKGDRLVDTGSFAVDDINLYGAEAALVYGPASLQGEYVFVDADTVATGGENFQSGFIQASYFLTGEHRPYKAGYFSRVSPKNNFSLDNGGAGAWELAARYSYLDLEDDTIDGGELHDITCAVNWYLNPHTRMMFDYTHAEDKDSPDAIDEADVFACRLQLDF